MRKEYLQWAIGPVALLLSWPPLGPVLVAAVVLFAPT